jgi:uncharacterized protein (DUF2249 family)
MLKPVVTLDVREDLAQGRPPCARILQVVETLKKGQQLRVIAPFQPTPLLEKLAGHGFGHLAREQANGDWEVLFDPAIKVNQVLHLEEPPPRDKLTLEIDLRGLEPPEPMTRILESLARIPTGGRLLARTDRRPIHLLPQLEQRGFKARSEPLLEGGSITRIERAEG